MFEKKIPAVGISDFSNLFGCMEFSLECKINGIQPIIGCNIFISDESFADGYLLLIAKNEIGFKNLSKLVSISYLDNDNYNNPYVSFKNIKNYSKNLICLAGGQFGFISKNYLKETSSKSDEAIKNLYEIFEDDFFLEIQKSKNENLELCKYIIKKSNDLKIPLVATNENFFLNKSFYQSHDALLSISEQKYLESEDRLQSNEDYCFKDENDIVKDFNQIPDAVENTLIIAKKCSFFLRKNLPNYQKLILIILTKILILKQNLFKD